MLLAACRTGLLMSLEEHARYDGGGKDAPGCLQHSLCHGMLNFVFVAHGKFVGVNCVGGYSPDFILRVLMPATWAVANVMEQGRMLLAACRTALSMILKEHARYSQSIRKAPSTYPPKQLATKMY